MLRIFWLLFRDTVACFFFPTKLCGNFPKVLIIEKFSQKFSNFGKTQKISQENFFEKKYPHNSYKKKFFFIICNDFIFNNKSLE